MSGTAEILVFVELVDGSPTDLSLQVLAKARELAPAGAGRVSAVVAGSGLGDVPATLVARGADQVLAADDPSLAGYLTGTYRRVLGAALSGRSPLAVLFPSSTTGNDLAPRIAAGMKAPCVLDASELTLDTGRLVARRSEFDRKVLTSFAPKAPGPLFVTLRDGVANPLAPDAGRTGGIVPLAVPAATGGGAARVVRRDVARKTVNLKDAKVIVAGGAGVGSREGFGLVEALAAALGGEVGATRAVVDAGWVSAERQVGQTGVTVRPDLYVACGVSGAVQHRVGMQDSKTIVAVNIDGSAPIFRCAHYRLVGDLKLIVPKLLKLLEERGKHKGEAGRG